MFATGKTAFALIVLCVSTVRADDDAPGFLQATPHFHNAIGANLKVEWSAQPTELPADAELTLTLKVTGATNPHRVRRPDLASVPAFKSRFKQITNGNDPPAARDAKSVTFTYRLRPRDADVRDIPEQQYGYYSPGAMKIETKYLETIPLNVRPAAAVPPVAQPLIAPERFFTIPTERELREGQTSDPDGWRWAGLLIFSLIAVGGGVVIWRRLYPDGHRLAKLRRNRAVRRVLEAIDAAPRTTDPLATAERAFRGYLMQRFGLLTPPTVPREIAASLTEANVPEEKVIAAVELGHKFDAARFGGAAAAATTLIEQTRRLILSWEGVT